MALEDVSTKGEKMTLRHLIPVLLILTAVLPTAVSASVADREHLAGRILLQVQSKGEAWYVDPIGLRRYSLGRPADALRVMRELGLGISNADLAGIPVAGSGAYGNVALRARLAGRILLQVQSKGEAWYVDPVTRERYSLGRPTEAFRLLQTKGLGITDADLRAIPEATLRLTSVFHTVPFTPQAPYAEWSDVRQQEGCEEASVIMAVKWAMRESLSLMEARTKILAMSDWQRERYGYYHDTSVQDTADRLFRDWYAFTNIEVRHDIDAHDIIEALHDGKIVITAIDGRTVGNPYFSVPPLRHMIVVTGYDATTDELITHDPGTKKGEGFRYPRSAMTRSLRDYPSGRYAPIPADAGTAMIIVHPKN